MVEETISKEVLLNRLKRLEGQIRGVEKMIEDGRDCESIVTQLGAVRSAIEGVGALLLRNYMKICFDNKTPECADIESLERAIAIWSRVHIGDKTWGMEKVATNQVSAMGNCNNRFKGSFFPGRNG